MLATSAGAIASLGALLQVQMCAAMLPTNDPQRIDSSHASTTSDVADAKKREAINQTQPRNSSATYLVRRCLIENLTPGVTLLANTQHGLGSVRSEEKGAYSAHSHSIVAGGLPEMS
jgi:hypothetical protein